jgi:aryl-alcohol dehydrogenase-like predicted oxidoreductase
MVAISLDAGVNFFDTADMYTSGESEIMLGKALKGKRHDAVIATKCGFRSGDAIISCGQLEDNLGAADLNLEQEDIRILDELTAIPVPYPAWMQAIGWNEKIKNALGIH